LGAVSELKATMSARSGASWSAYEALSAADKQALRIV